jgi:hypothetical protein
VKLIADRIYALLVTITIPKELDQHGAEEAAT